MAFLLAPVIAALTVGALFGLAGLVSGWGLASLWVGAYSALIGYLWLGWIPTLFLGVPAFFLLQRWLPLRPWNCAMVGGAIVAITVLAGSAVLAGFGDAQAIRGLVGVTVATAAVGAYGGWMFWLIAAWRPTGTRLASLGGTERDSPPPRRRIEPPAR